MVDLNIIRECNKMISILEKELKQKRKEIDAFNTTYNEIRANIINSMTEHKVLSIIKLEEDIQSYKEKRDKAIVEIREIINKLDDEIHRKLLELRYIDCMDWKDITEIIGYSKRYTLKKHAKALKKISKILKEDIVGHSII
ncbi:MAG: hypothetical protein K2L15_04940 [Eubacteriales bacterium]|nr:hypothetical protein [Eubacteriales bacterium]